MHSIVTYIIAGIIGIVIAYLISRGTEWGVLRLLQLVCIPIGTVVCAHFTPTRGSSATGDMGSLIVFLAVLFFMVLLIAPSLAQHIGVGASNFLDPGDWTPLEEELALRPIRKLIDHDEFREALEDLTELLKKHKPTYEAILLKAQLLYHFGRINETETTLLSLIAWSKTAKQQMAVMELLALLEPYFSHAYCMEINHELILFPTVPDSAATHKEIPPGIYDVEEILHRNRRWLKLVGQDWGNAEICWKAIEKARYGAAGSVAEKSVASKVATVVKKKSFRQKKDDAQGYLKEANHFIRNDDWSSALPLLQKASAYDPERYEIAYRWVQAVRNTGNEAATARAVSKALRQGRWTDDERNMLEQLKQPVTT